MQMLWFDRETFLLNPNILCTLFFIEKKMNKQGFSQLRKTFFLFFEIVVKYFEWKILLKLFLFVVVVVLLNFHFRIHSKSDTWKEINITNSMYIQNGKWVNVHKGVHKQQQKSLRSNSKWKWVKKNGCWATSVLCLWIKESLIVIWNEFYYQIFE